MIVCTDVVIVAMSVDVVVGSYVSDMLCNHVDWYGLM